MPDSPDWKIAVTPPPPELDYEMWIGPARMEPYIKARVHMNWRWNYNIGGGQLLDWIGHHCDIAHWGMDLDNNGPSEIEGHGEFPPADAIWNTCTKYRITLKYPQGHHHDHRRRPSGHSQTAPNGSAPTAGSGWTAAAMTPPTSIGSRRSRRTGTR